MNASTKADLASSAKSLMFVVGYVQRLLRFEARHEKIGWTALMVLKDLDFVGPSSQRVLAEIEQVRAPTMTVLIDQMERKGWVQRRPDPDDARSYKVTITAEGTAQLRAPRNREGWVCRNCRLAGGTRCARDRRHGSTRSEPCGNGAGTRQECVKPLEATRNLARNVG